MGKITFGMRLATLLVVAFLFDLTEAGLGQSPEVVSRPENQAVPEGGNAILSVSVTGELPITYQWRRWKGSVISDYWNPTLDSTNCTLVLTNVQASDACLFLLDINNAAGHSSGVLTTVAVFSSNMATNGFTVTINGDTNLNWRVDYTTNFHAPDWVTLTNLIIPEFTPEITFTDLEATNLSRFYRVIPVPE